MTGVPQLPTEAGKVQASSGSQDMRLQPLCWSHLSALAVKEPKDILVVACGARGSPGSFVPYPDVKNITICDIEPLVPTRVTPMFTKENYGIVDGIDKQNPKVISNNGDKTVTVEYDDGRHFIRTTKKMFDVITSDPIDPWVKGCAALNSVEYYTMCKEHLNPGGVVTLWIPIYESNLPTFKSVLATFFEVFPNGVSWSNDQIRGEGYDAVLFGQVEPTVMNLDKLVERLDKPDYGPVRTSLAQVGFGTSGFETSY